MARKCLVICGILAILWYAAMNILVPMQYPGYNSASQTVSELSAINTPTRSFWFVLGIIYSLFYIAFGIGIWLSAEGNRKLQIVGTVIVFDGVLGIFWPPMHQREVIAAGGGTLSDTLHLVWAFIHLALMLLMIGFGASALGKRFRIFSVAVVLIFLVFGFLTSKESMALKANLPTPHIGIWERINIGAYMIWIIVFASILLRRNSRSFTYSQTV
jgi:hypothetical protein